MKRNMFNWLVGPLARISGTDAVELLGMDTCVDDDGLFSAWPTGPMGALPAAKKAITRTASREYREWLAKNLGGGYGSYFEWQE